MGDFGCRTQQKINIRSDDSGDKLHNVWNEAKKPSLYFLELKPFLGERLAATDYAIPDSFEPADSSSLPAWKIPTLFTAKAEVKLFFGLNRCYS